MITFEHVAMEYLPGREILKDVSLELKRGSFHFVTGASGTGKSTLLSLLSLQQRALRGHIHMFGEEVTHLPREKLPRLRRRVGVVLQDYRLLEHLTVAENVGLPLKVAGEPKEKTRAKVLELLGWIGLSGCGDVRPATLSGGQKQRAAIARAVIAKPDLLLADEPTGNLDSELALRFMYLFEALNRDGATVVIATHDEHLISLFKYPVLRLKEGRLAMPDAAQKTSEKMPKK
ncbi:MAG: ATP-binding cassette domain-containing protein [Pseudomonadota bacterium]|nr:ATP-binding cassette domain-containing protein [Pseudomonadota bacterium]